MIPFVNSPLRSCLYFFVFGRVGGPGPLEARAESGRGGGRSHLYPGGILVCRSPRIRSCADGQTVRHSNPRYHLAADRGRGTFGTIAHTSDTGDVGRPGRSGRKCRYRRRSLHMVDSDGIVGANAGTDTDDRTFFGEDHGGESVPDRL